MAISSSPYVQFLDPNSKEANGRDGDDVCKWVIELYQRAMTNKINSGLQTRLRNAYQYSITDRVDRMVFHAPEKDDPAEEDCEDCDGLFSVNLDFIRLQHDTALSLYMDALKSRGHDYSTIDPTPIPDSPEDVKKRISDAAMQSILRDIASSVAEQAATPEQENILSISVLEGLLGTSEGLERLDEFIARQRTIETSRMYAESQKKARNAKVLVDDILTESEYDDVILRSASDSFWYDISVVYAPFKAAVDTTEVHNGKLRETTKKKWAMRNVHPINFFYSESTTFSDMGDYVGEILWMSRNDVGNMANMTGGQEDNIQDVLDSFESYQELHLANEKDEYSQSPWQFQNQIPVIKILVKLSTEQAESIFSATSVKRGRSDHLAELVCVRDKVLFKRLYPTYKNYSPYRINSFTVSDETELSSGRGLYSVCRTPQEMIDNSILGVFGNMQDLNKYMIEVNESKLSDPDELEDSLEEERPIIRTKGTGNYATYGGNDRALHIHTVPDNLSSFISTLLQGIELMERVGFSAFALGQGNFPNVRSAGQSAILQGNANKRFMRFLQQQEKWVETPTIDYVWTAEAITGNDPAIVVDSTISVKSYTGFLQKQNQSEEVGLFLQSMVGFMNARFQLEQSGQDVSFFDSLLRQYVDASGFDSSEIEGIAPDVGALGQAVTATDPVNQPIQQLDGRSNVPADVNQVVPS